MDVAYGHQPKMQCKHSISSLKQGRAVESTESEECVISANVIHSLDFVRADVVKPGTRVN